MGAMDLQGPHHGAQKSTNTGKSQPNTSASKLLSPTSVIFPIVLSPYYRSFLSLVLRVTGKNRSKPKAANLVYLTRSSKEISVGYGLQSRSRPWRRWRYRSPPRPARPRPNAPTEYPRRPLAKSRRRLWRRREGRQHSSCPPNCFSTPHDI